MKYIILGAGPAGLTLANRLLEKGIKDFIVLEAENEAGGACRSSLVDGKPFDIGGGHFLDVKRPKVVQFIFSFLPQNEWNLFDRNSQILLQGKYMGHPLESNIWQLPIDIQIEYLISIAKAGSTREVPMPKKFTEWIHWKFGKRIAEDYMLPYNRKVFGEELDRLGTYWLEKLPNVSLEETFRSCIEHKAYGLEPGHTQFYYPCEYGYGEVWKRMGSELGQRLKLNARVKHLDSDNRIVFVSSGESYQADTIITTIPWTSFEIEGSDTHDIIKNIQKLKHTGIETRYYSENLDTPAHWIYEPNESKAYHRILVRHNFCYGSKGHWRETNINRIKFIPEGEKNNTSFQLEYAYPLNTVDKENLMKRIKLWAVQKKIICLGRWGEHCHYNSDVVVEKALRLAEELL